MEGLNEIIVIDALSKCDIDISFLQNYSQHNVSYEKSYYIGSITIHIAYSYMIPTIHVIFNNKHNYYYGDELKSILKKVIKHRRKLKIETILK